MNDFHNQHLFKMFTEAYPGIVSYMDQEHRYQYVSEAYREWFNVEPAEVLGKKIEDIIGAESYQIRRPYMERALKGEKVVFQSHLNHQLLGRRDTEQIYHPDVDSEGKIKGIFSLAHDVTERLISEKKAEESQMIFRSYAESMPQMAFIADPKGKIIYFNKQWEQYSGIDPYSYDDSTNKVLHPEDLPKMVKVWSESLKTGKTYQLEERLLRRDGVYRWHLAQAVPVRGRDGQISEWMGNLTDIHDYKENEQEQARLIQVLEGSSDFIGMASLEGKILYLNNTGRRMLGIDLKTDITTIDRQALMFEEDRHIIADEMKPAVMEKGFWLGELRLKHQLTGDEVWVHYNHFATRNFKTGEITGFATVARDLGDIKAKEVKLENALKTRDEFLSIASHELKTPLTSLKLQAQIFLRSLKKGDQQAVAHEKLENMAIQSNELVSRLSRLIDDMLDVSRIRTGKLNLDKSSHDMLEITRHVLERMSIQFLVAGIEHPTIKAQQPVLGVWDSFRIEQVLTNLLTNAIRYGQGNPIEIEILPVANRVQLKVKDNGYGISKEDQERIFDRFERAINASEVSGMGLGLFITKEIIKSHEGEIWVESELGSGATFIVDLPLA